LLVPALSPHDSISRSWQFQRKDHSVLTRHKAMIVAMSDLI